MHIPSSSCARRSRRTAGPPVATLVALCRQAHERMDGRRLSDTTDTIKQHTKHHRGIPVYTTCINAACHQAECAACTLHCDVKYSWQHGRCTHPHAQFTPTCCTLEVQCTARKRFNCPGSWSGSKGKARQGAHVCPSQQHTHSLQSSRCVWAR